MRGREQPIYYFKGHKINEQIGLWEIKNDKVLKFVGAIEEIMGCERGLSVTPTTLLKSLRLTGCCGFSPCHLPLCFHWSCTLKKAGCPSVNQGYHIPHSQPLAAREPARQANIITFADKGLGKGTQVSTRIGCWEESCLWILQQVQGMITSYSIKS